MADIKDTSLTYGRGYVYTLQYHIVWCVKYRRNVLTGNVEQSLKQIINDTADELKFKILAMECNEDHIHLLVDCTPQHNLSTLIKVLKGNTARKLFILYPQLKKQLWDGHLWNPSYFVATVSDRTQQQIKEYINHQKKR